MGYHTDFSGKFYVTPVLSPKHAAYMRKFAKTRRMQRDATAVAKRADPLRLAVGLPVGIQGGYFVGDEEYATHGACVIDCNRPPAHQPGLWCQWQPTEDGAAIEWDGGEKFYNYIEWLQYLISRFLLPWGYTLNGLVEWSGEAHGDVGVIVVKNNIVTTKRGRVTYSEDSDD